MEPRVLWLEIEGLCYLALLLCHAIDNQGHHVCMGLFANIRAIVRFPR